MIPQPIISRARRNRLIVHRRRLDPYKLIMAALCGCSAAAWVFAWMLCR